MDVGLAVVGDDRTEETRALHAWLLREDELRGRIRLEHAPSRPGDMGSLVDMLTVAVGAGGALTVLARSIEVWLRQPRRAMVRVKVTGPDGSVVELSADHVKEVGSVEALLEQALRPMRRVDDD